MPVTWGRSLALLALAFLLPACGGGGGGNPVGLPGTFTLVAPAAGVTGVAPRTAFSWNTSTGAVSYLLEVAKDAAFTQIVVQTSTAGTALTLSAPLQGLTVHFWRVTASNAAGSQVCDAAPRQFTTGPPVPGNFSLLKPIGGITGVTVYAVLSWDASADATAYLLEISTVPDFSTIAIQKPGLTQVSHATETRLNDGTTYYWRVTASNPNGIATAGPESFTTAPLAAPTWAGVAVGLADTYPQYFVSVNPSDAAIARISGEGVEGFTNVSDLAYDAVLGQFFGSDIGTGQLLRIDPTTGVVTNVGFTHVPDLTGLAIHTGTQTLFATALNEFNLLTLNKTTGAATVVGAMGSFGFVRGLCFDAASGFLLGSYGGQVCRFDPATGAGTAIGPFTGIIPGMEIDSGTGTLYGVEDLNDKLVTLNKSTGQSTDVGPLGLVGGAIGLGFDSTNNVLQTTNGRRFQPVNRATGAATGGKGWSFSDVRGLAYHPGLGKLYGVGGFPPELIQIDPTTGIGRSIAPVSVPDMQSLAFDPNASILYTVDRGTATLYRIDITTGAATMIGSSGSLGSGAVYALEFDPVSNTLYAYDSHRSIVRINTTDGTSTSIGATIHNIEGIAFDPTTGHLYAASTSDQYLYRISPQTGAAARVGPIARHIIAMSFDPATGMIFTVSGQYDSAKLFRMDPLTGRTTSVGMLGLNSGHSLAYDPFTQTLYGMDRPTNPPGRLVRIDPATGASTAIGTTGFHNIESMAFDPSTRTLYAVNSGSDQLLTINPNTSAVTVIGAVGFSTMRGLAVHPTTNILYGIADGTNRLITINKATGAGTAVGAVGSLNATGLAFHPSTQQLYAVDMGTRNLYTVSIATGVPSLVGKSARGLWDIEFR